MTPRLSASRNASSMHKFGLWRPALAVPGRVLRITTAGCVRLNLPFNRRLLFGSLAGLPAAHTRASLGEQHLHASASRAEVDRRGPPAVASPVGRGAHGHILQGPGRDDRQHTVKPSGGQACRVHALRRVAATAATSASGGHSRRKERRTSALTCRLPSAQPPPSRGMRHGLEASCSTEYMPSSLQGQVPAAHQPGRVSKSSRQAARA